MNFIIFHDIPWYMGTLAFSGKLWDPQICGGQIMDPITKMPESSATSVEPCSWTGLSFEGEVSHGELAFGATLVFRVLKEITLIYNSISPYIAIILHMIGSYCRWEIYARILRRLISISVGQTGQRWEVKSEIYQGRRTSMALSFHIHAIQGGEIKTPADSV